MTLFAHQFRQHVIPRLQEQARTEALAFASGLREWGECHANIMGAAISRGALYLPDAMVSELDDWISTALTTEIESIEAEAERQCAVDPIGHYEALASGCSQPDQMRWVFAAISPEYRAHLLAVKRAT